MSQFQCPCHSKSNQPDISVLIAIMVLVACMAGLLFGLGISIAAGALHHISDTFNLSANAKTSLPITYSLFHLWQMDWVTIEGWIVSALPAGALLGAIASSKCSSGLGRNKSIIISGIIYFAGAIISCYAQSVEYIIAGRLLCGISIGLSSTIVPMYLSEISPPKIRGTIIFMFQFAITVGILIAFYIDYLFQATANWRAMFGICSIPALFLVLSTLFLPQSPRWLAQRNRVEEAKAVLMRLMSQEEAEYELAGIEESSHRASGSFSLLFKKPIRSLVILSFGLFVFQQLTGINSVFYYAPDLFKAAGFEGNSAQMIAAMATGATNVIASILGVFLIDRIGRRKLLISGLAGIVICHITLVLSYYHLLGNDVRWIVVGASLLFICFFAVGVSAIPYIIMSEIFPLNERSAGMAFAGCGNWLFNMFVAATFLKFVQYFGIGNTYLFYAVCSFIGLIFVITLMPETKGTSLEDIEHNLYNGVKLRDLGKPVVY